MPANRLNLNKKIAFNHYPRLYYINLLDSMVWKIGDNEEINYYISISFSSYFTSGCGDNLKRRRYYPLYRFSACRRLCGTSAVFMGSFYNSRGIYFFRAASSCDTHYPQRIGCEAGWILSFSLVGLCRGMYGPPFMDCRLDKAAPPA